MQKLSLDGENMIDKTKKSLTGSISIFLTLVMLPVFTFAGLVVDGARISAARTSVSGAGDLAMNAALSEYNKTLYDVYGLFAVSENMDELQENVSRYFSNSIENSGIMDDSDSYTREFINSIFSMFSGNEVEFSNIIDTKVDSNNGFKLIGVESSSIANPSVLERQIIEHMKYRAPINLTKGLLTKLGCIGETSKQTKAIEAKVDYEKKLNTVQDACETAYNAINTYNSIVTNSKFGQTNYISNISQSITSAKNSYNKMTQYIIALNSPALKATALSEDSELKNEVNNAYNRLSSENKEWQTLNNIKSKLKPYVELVERNDKYDFKPTDFMRKITRLGSTIDDTSLENQINYILQYNDISDMKKVYTLLNLYKTYYNKLTENEKSMYKKEYDTFEGIRVTLYGHSATAQEKSNNWKQKVNEHGKASGKELYEKWYSSISGINKTLDDAIEALEVVIEKVGELDSARTKWSNKVDNLSDSSVKTSMKGDYENSAKDINEDAINELKNILSENKKHFETIKERLDSIKYFEKGVCFSDYSTANFYERFSSSIGNTSVSSIGEITSKANSLMNSKYQNKDVNNLNPSSYKKIDENGAGMQFYRYLVKVCTSSEAESNKDAKKEAKKNKEALIDKGNSIDNTNAAGLSADIPKSVDSAIPEDVQKALDALYSSEGKNDTFNPENVKKKGKDSAIADQNKNNLTQISDLLKSLSEIAQTAGEKARDNLYVEEYLTEMFSCYTDTVRATATTPVMSLNNKDMSKNKFFGSEVEYILWGQDTVQTNLNYSKAMIFGIRFALNSIYAFTNTDTRTPALLAATAIAGWTGFGVPIVQTVILLSWSMAESYFDVDFLCEGKAVALYKTKDTWFLGYGGLKDILIEKSVAVAHIALDNVFDDIEKAAIDASGKIVGNAEDSIINYTENTLDGVYESIQGAIAIPIEQLAVQITGSSEALSKNDITEKVKKTLSGLKNSGDGLVNECVNLAVDSLLRSEVGDIATKLTEMYEKSKNKDATIEEINKLLYGIGGESGFIGDLNFKIRNIADTKVKEYGDKFKNEVNGMITSGSAKAKESIKDSISGFASGISGNDSSSNGNTAAASGFTMTYKEYLKAFIMIHMITSSDNKDAMLKRTAQLIQANITALPEESDFSIATSYTMVKASATISVRTTFFNIPVESGVDSDGKTTYSLNYGNIGSDRQYIKYTSILGY